MASSEGNEVNEIEQEASVQCKINELKSSRSSTKGNITRIKTMIAKKGANLSTEELNCRMGILESYFKQFLSVQANLDKLNPAAESVSADITTEIEDTFVATKSKIMTILSKRKSSVVDVSHLSTTGTSAVAPRARREIKLPTFSGKYSEYPKFITLFKKLIHQDESFEDCERFLILKEHLSCDPLAAIEDFDVTDDNYPKALDSLNECFDKKALMFEEHIRALFSIPKATKASSAHLRNVVNAANAHLSAMLSLDDYKDVTNAMLIHMVMEKVDEDSQVKWEESVDYNKLSTWEECSTVLTRRYENLEARESKLGPVCSKFASSQRDFKNKRPNQTSFAVVKSSCKICNNSIHDLPDCYMFKRFSLKERYSAARKLSVCFRCLKRGHYQKDCTAAKCPRCNLPHHQLLHKDYASEATFDTSSNLPSTSTQAVARSSVMNVTAEPEVILATAMVLIKDNCGKYHSARAILDSGSQVNLMSETLAQKLLLKRTSCKLVASSVGSITTVFRKHTIATIKSRLNEFQFSLEFYVLPKITSSKPDRYFDVSSWNLPKNIKLADPMFNKPLRVDILIGAEIFFELMSVGRILLDENLPILQKSIFGWIVAGKAKEGSAPMGKIDSLLFSYNNHEDKDLSNLVEKFWEMETVSPKTKFMTEEEEKCERIFIESISTDTSGRFIVKIPFKSSVKELGGSYKAAERRLLLLERRLNRDPSTRNSYNAFMEEYLSLGHMAVVQKADMNKIKYFAPHQHVLRPESTSTKLRVVFDCSCKTDSGLSLNEVMMKGPVVQDDLLSIILRFRCYKYAITADVTKMYRQAWVTEGDANYQAILWRSSPEEKLKAYRLRTITYGTTSAPYLATRCLKKLGEDSANDYAIGSKKILSDFYMDDLISGSNNENEIFEIYNQVSKILNTAKFSLRKWYSNSKRFLKTVPEADKEKTLRLNEEEIIKTLGIVWAPVGDTFRYVWPDFDDSKAVTKRIVLAELSKLFDPLGLINPLIVKAKIFMQDLWILKVNWDESLPMDLHSQWTKFRFKLQDVKTVCIPRIVLTTKTIIRVEMHGFADASKRAYGCCIYIRTISTDKDITINLWSAKSRVSPLKTQSLPRLELLAALLLSKLVAKTKINFSMPIDATYLWTDSEIVLDWLSEHPSNWNTFVANRVSQIQEESKLAIWRHVPSKSNPADIISRGAYIDELTNSCWFAGPEFLKKSCDEWPPNNNRRKGKADQERSRSNTILVLNPSAAKNTVYEKDLQVDRRPYILHWIETFSDFEKLQRVFVNLLGFRRDNKSSTEKFDEAMIRIFYCVQQYYFREEIVVLLKKRKLPANNKYKSLSVFIENSHGIPLLRVGGRLSKSKLPYDAKHQILLPNKSEIVGNFVRFLHRKYLHAGLQTLLAIIRQRFWIVNARGLIRKVTGSCLQCFRCRPKLSTLIMGDLPSSRVVVTKLFTVTGVDFCGPIATTYKLRGCRTTKSYIAVFICFSTKAVHMEVVSDLTAKAFLAALKRFVARRGLCSKLYCDNATNFVGARRELEEMKNKFFDQQMQGKISSYCATNNIEFHHIPPRSPHFGGLWEAAVKRAKYHLVRILGESYLTFEELATVVAEVEAVLNSRPLTAMSSDPNDENVLTPAHFLTGGPLIGIEEPTFESKAWSHLDRWLRVSAIQQHFWRRWSTEYLNELQQKAKWTKRQCNLNEGDLVLVAEDNLPSRQWLIGRVLKVTRDAKGLVRVADVKTKNGEVRRAIHKLARIPYEG